MGISETGRMTRAPVGLSTRARSCTVPPTLVWAAIRRSARPLFLMARYATVVPGVVGCGTYALVTPIDEAAPAAVHPASATAASSTALARPARDVSLRIAPGYRAVLVRRQPRSTA